MPIATLSPDIDPSLSPLAADAHTDAEGRSIYVDAEGLASPQHVPASAAESAAFERFNQRGLQ